MVNEESLTLRESTRGPDSIPERVSLGPAPLEEAALGERYRAKTVLGEGGMGQVLLCRDERIGRDVAMKRIRDEVATSDGQAARFVREARVQAQLDHPTVVPVYDLGVAADGRAFFTMKRVRGVTLTDVLEQQRASGSDGRYTQHRVLAAFAQVCIAVHYAHVRGVVHRDLKPENVMLGEFGEVYLLDWGIARVDGALELAEPGRVMVPEAGGRTPTREGAVFGTPGYMAPEQARGLHSQLDHRADVYALGTILFEILALEPLHRGSNAVEILTSTLVGHDAGGRLRARDVAPELEAACVRATELDPERRFPTARLLHDAVERYLEGDRDLERRRKLADSHAGAAEDHAERALSAGGTAEDRGVAVRAAGRALVLDQANERATRVMLQLFAKPPRELPAAAQAPVQAEVARTIATVARRGALVYGAWLACFPIAIAMGVRDAGVMALQAALLALAVAIATIGSRSGRMARPLIGACFVAGSIAIGLESWIFGPFVIGPTLAVVHTMFFVMLPGRAWRATVIVVGCAVTVVPWALEVLGLVAPSGVFESGGGYTLLPRMVSLSPGLSAVLLVTSGIVPLAFVGIFLGRFRDALREAEERVRLYAWHLEHLVPEESQRAIEPDPPA